MSSTPSKRVKKTLKTPGSGHPANIHVEVALRPHTTIRASVKDVEFTLDLTVALVVMVIFVFLRSFWATIIPSVTVPLALLGACASHVGG